MQEIVSNNSLTFGEYLEKLKITLDALTGAAWVLVAIGLLAVIAFYIILNAKYKD